MELVEGIHKQKRVKNVNVTEKMSCHPRLSSSSFLIFYLWNYWCMGFTKGVYIYILFVVQNLIQTHPSSHRPLRFHTTSGWAPPNSVFLTWYGKWGDMYMYIYINANVLYIHKCITYTYMQMYYISIFKYVDVLPYQQQNSRQIIK